MYIYICTHTHIYIYIHTAVYAFGLRNKKCTHLLSDGIRLGVQKTICVELIFVLRDDLEKVYTLW